MEDRSKDALEVITWLKENYPENTNTLGLYGASQAGWVIP